jgi:CubicO group peptidase (beta-lactamase class C family)
VLATGWVHGRYRATVAIADEVDGLARQSRFSGVIRVDHAGSTDLAVAYGDADRAHRIANEVDTQLAIASGVKGLTATAVMSLVADGTLSLTTSARDLLGGDLPLIDDDVTVEHLLAHRSGIGDYLDEEQLSDIDDYAMAVPVHLLATTEKFPAGTRFSYCNGGYVVLALLAERATGLGFHDLVTDRVLAPAGMGDTAFLRSDELPGRAAIGYLGVDGLRTNVLHLPVRGNGDGGIYTTVADVLAFWDALFAGRLLPPAQVAEMTAVRSEAGREPPAYGLGFWLRPATGSVLLTGYDAGVSFRSARHPASALTATVVANTSEGAWPIGRLLDRLLGL